VCIYTYIHNNVPTHVNGNRAVRNRSFIYFVFLHPSGCFERFHTVLSVLTRGGNAIKHPRANIELLPLRVRRPVRKQLLRWSAAPVRAQKTSGKQSSLPPPPPPIVRNRFVATEDILLLLLLSGGLRPISERFY